MTSEGAQHFADMLQENKVALTLIFFTKQLYSLQSHRQSERCTFTLIKSIKTYWKSLKSGACDRAIIKSAKIAKILDLNVFYTKYIRLIHTHILFIIKVGVNERSRFWI